MTLKFLLMMRFQKNGRVYSKEEISEQEKLFKFQREWFLDLYGFNDERHLAEHLRNFKYILDAGCGLGYKAAWFASLAPNSKVMGIDFSSASYTAYQRYKDKFPNLLLLKGILLKHFFPLIPLDLQYVIK